VLAQREGHVLEHAHVGEQRAELEQHAHATAQPVKALGVERVHVLAADTDAALRWLQLSADEPQQGGLAAAAAAHDRHEAPARNAHGDALEDRTAAVRKAHLLDLDQGFGHARNRGKRRSDSSTSRIAARL
jgi:hypothetical protein